MFKMLKELHGIFILLWYIEKFFQCFYFVIINTKDEISLLIISCWCMCSTAILSFDVMPRRLQAETDRYWIVEASDAGIFHSKTIQFSAQLHNNDVSI